MAPRNLGDLLERPVIDGLIQKVTQQCERLLPKFEETERYYLSRLRIILLELKEAMASVSEMNTSIEVARRLMGSLSAIDDELRNWDTQQPINFNKLRETMDSVIEVMPFLAFSPVLNNKRVHAVQEIEVEKNNVVAGIQESLNQLRIFVEQSRDVATKESEKVIAAAREELLGMQHLSGKSKDIANEIAGKRLSGEFANQADAHWWWGIGWTAATAVFGLVTAGLLAYAWYQYGSNPTPRDAGGSLLIDFPQIVKQALLTLTVGLLARWTSKRANHELQEQSKYRRLALNLDSMNSFLANLDEQHKQRATTYIATRLLSEYPSENPNTEFDSMFPNELIEIIRSPVKPE